MNLDFTHWLVLVLLSLWIAVKFKRSRPDGALVKGVAPYRNTLFHIMPTPALAEVSYDYRVDVEPASN